MPVVENPPPAQNSVTPEHPTSKNRSTSNKNFNNSQQNSENTGNNFLADILEILTILKTFLKDLNLKNIIQMFKNFISIFKSDKPIDAIYALLEQVVNGKGSSHHHGQSA